MAQQNLVNILRLSALLGIALAQVASLRSAEAPSYQGHGEPLHPSAITTQHNGQTEPVVAVSGQTAQIEVGGQKIPLGNNVGYTFARLANFSPGFVKIARHGIVQVEKQTRSADGLIINELSDDAPTDEYQATLVSDTAFPDAFLVLVIFDREFLTGETTTPNPALFFKHIGALRPNENKDVIIALGRLSSAARQCLEFFPLMFADGREVRSQLSELSAAYFRRVEMARHVNVVKNYLSQNSDADRPIQPYVRIAPILPESSSTGESTKLNVRLTIAEDGTVKQADLLGEVPAPIKSEVERALRGWLFLPKLVKGKPVDAKAVVPLQVSL